MIKKFTLFSIVLIAIISLPILFDKTLFDVVHMQTKVNDTITLGGETFKIVKVIDEETSMALLTRFTKTDTTGTIVGSTLANHNNYQNLVSGTANSFIDEFNNMWEPRLNSSEKARIVKMAYCPSISDIENIPFNVLSNANLQGSGGLNGDNSWWVINPRYNHAVNYVAADGSYDAADQWRKPPDVAGVRLAIQIKNTDLSFIEEYGTDDNGNALDAYYYDMNTKQGDALGKFKILGTIPTGFKVINDSANSSDYTNFDTSINENGEHILIVKNADLNAGTYKLRIESVGGDFTVVSDDITITVKKGKQEPLIFFEDAAKQNEISSYTIASYIKTLTLYVGGGSSLPDGSGYMYHIVNNSSNVLSDLQGNDTNCLLTLSGQVGSFTIRVTKRGDTNYEDESKDIVITTVKQSSTPNIAGIKIDNSSQYPSGTQYNKDVKITFSYPNSYIGTELMKLKERDINNYNTPWNSIAARDIEDGYEITLNLGNEEWIYKEYELYFDGHEDEAATFIVDISNVIPDVVEVTDGETYTEKKQVNLNLNQGRLPTTNPYSATLNGNVYTSLADIGNGTHILIVQDAYGNQQTINFTVKLEGAQGIFRQTKTLIYDDASTDKNISNKQAGKVTITSGEGPYSYSSKDTNTSSKFRIDSQGNVYIVDGVDLGAGAYPVTFTVTDGNSVTSDISGTIKVEKGKQSDFRFVDDTLQMLPNNNGIYNVLEEVYEKNKHIFLDVLGNKGSVTYKLKDTSVIENGITIDLSDVIDIDPSTGDITIKNASLATQLGKVIVVATSAATSNYEEKSIEIPLNVLKGSQKDFAFKFADKTVQAGKGSFKPDFINGPSNGKIKLTSTDAMVTVTGSDNDTFDYNVPDKKDIVLKAQKVGNRNYEDSPIVSMTLHVLEKGQTLFDVRVEPQDTSANKVYYGDTTARFIPVDPEENATFQYKSLDNTIAEMIGDDIFLPKKAGTVTFEIIKSIPGENDITITKEVIIYPKPITITINDKAMLKGEAVPPFTFQVSSNDLVGMDTITNITLYCKNGSYSVDSNTAKGTYSIKGSYTESDYPNYDINIKDGTLTIDQETPLAIWYELLGTLGDSHWYISDVDVKIAEAATDKDYTVISGDQLVWADQFTINKDGINKFTAYFKKDSGAISFGIDGEVKIDKKTPIIKSIQAKNSNNSIEDLMNTITFNAFFKKGTDILIQGDDSNGTAKVSGVKEASYTIQKLDKDNNPNGEAVTGTVAADANGLMKVTMDEVGTYNVCALLKDNAGNEMDEQQCVQVSIKDPQKDFDSNDDGCPDLNVTLGTSSPELNIDKNLDGVPELNIDTNGDGKADINIDSDGDGKPDVNLIILSDWKPSVCTIDQQYNYGYQPDIKAKINIAKDNKKAELNIDWDGDMKADFNIDNNHDGKADVNVGKIHTWKPEQDYQYVGFDYDTIKKNSIIPTLNIDTDGDGLPDVNLDLNSDGIPELNIDNTGDMKPDIDIDSDGDGVADINIDENGDGKADKNITTITEWKPNKNCEKDGFKYDTMGNLAPDLIPDPNPDNPDNPDDSNNPDTSGLDTLIHDDTQIEVTIKGNKHFKSSMKLVVDDITNIIGNEDYAKIMKDESSSQDVKKVFNARLIEDNIVVQPDGTIEVKIPITNDLKAIKNLSILLEKNDGTYEKVNFKAVNGYYVFTTDYLGKISIIGDKENTVSPNDSETSVKGAYKNNAYGSGGVNTGDETNIYFLFISMIITLSILITYYNKSYKKD